MNKIRDLNLLKINDLFKLNEGIDIQTYLYRMNEDPGCNFGYPILKNAQSSSLLNDYLALQNIIQKYLDHQYINVESHNLHID